MKIAILTQPLGKNYGGILQAYALSKILSEQGHDVVVVNRLFPRISQTRKYLGIFKRTLLRFFKAGDTRIVPHYLRDKESRLVYSELVSFVHDNIKLSRGVYNSEGLRSLQSEYSFDAYVVGSDQVWRPKYSPNILNYFADFLEDNASVKLIAYAASFGVDKWEFTPHQTALVSHYVKKFKSISVREKSGLTLCSEFMNVEAELALDPTMLVSLESYLSLIKTADNTAQTENYLFFYLLDETEANMRLLKHISDKYVLGTRRVLPAHRFENDNYENVRDCLYPSIGVWLDSIANSSLVFTDSFHGTVFSILFNKPFFVYVNKARGASRFESLLGVFNLEDRIISEETDIKDFDYDSKINWPEVNTILEQQKTKSLLFLTNSLGA